MSVLAQHGMLLSGLGKARYLDEIAVSPLLCFSLRKLISTATAAIRVRRSSDSSEQDIGFAGRALDVDALEAFVGGGGGYVVALYDQSGNGWGATQADPSKQPRIVDSGTAHGAITFDGVDDALIVESLAMGTQFVGAYSRLSLVPTGSYKMAFEAGPDSGLRHGGFGLFADSNFSRVIASMRGENDGGRSNIYEASLPSLEQVSLLYDRTLTGVAEIQMFRNGVFQTPVVGASGNQTGNFVTHDFHIGARVGSSLFADLELESLVIYTSDTAAIREVIEEVVSF